MKLSLKEYDAMQSGWRKWVNEHMEIAGFKAWGMDIGGKDILIVMTRKDQIRNVYRTTGGRAGFHAFPDKEAAFPFVCALMAWITLVIRG